MKTILFLTLFIFSYFVNGQGINDENFDQEIKWFLIINSSESYDGGIGYRNVDDPNFKLSSGQWVEIGFNSCDPDKQRNSYAMACVASTLEGPVHLRLNGKGEWNIGYYRGVFKTLWGELRAMKSSDGRLIELNGIESFSIKIPNSVDQIMFKGRNFLDEEFETFEVKYENGEIYLKESLSEIKSLIGGMAIGQIGFVFDNAILWSKEYAFKTE